MLKMSGGPHKRVFVSLADKQETIFFVFGTIGSIHTLRCNSRED